MVETVGKGWAFITASRKWHYYLDDGRSLCRKFMVLKSTFEKGNDNSPDNCSACRDRLLKLKPATPAQSSAEQSPARETEQSEGRHV